MKIAVLCQLWPAVLQDLQRRYDCVVTVNPTTHDKWQLVADAEIVVLRSPVVLDRETIERAECLRLVVRAGAGLDNIDCEALSQRGIQTICVPLSAQSVAEHTFGLILALYRNIPWLHRALGEGRWEKHHGYGRELSGKTLGLLGFGRIGIGTARLAQAFQMPLLAHDRSPAKRHKQRAADELCVDFVALPDLFARSDIVTIQIPLDSHRHVVGKELIGLMKADAVLVNVGRGPLVDEAALYQALCERRLFGAACDVFSQEPPLNSPLLNLENFIGTPHVGAQTVEAQQKVGEDVVRIVDAYAAGKHIDQVNVGRPPAWSS